jgi:hypothetical protein
LSKTIQDELKLRATERKLSVYSVRVEQLTTKLLEERRLRLETEDLVAKLRTEILTLTLDKLADDQHDQDNQQDDFPDPHLACRQALASARQQAAAVVREARDLSALLVQQNREQQSDPSAESEHEGEAARPPYKPTSWRNAKYLTATLSNKYFRKCQDVAHMEQRLETLVSENLIRRRVMKNQRFVSTGVCTLMQTCASLKQLFGLAVSEDLVSDAEREFWAHAQNVFEQGEERLRKLAHGDSKWLNLFDAFDAACNSMAVECGTSPHAKVLEDVNTTLAELIDWAEGQFFPEQKHDSEEPQDQPDQDEAAKRAEQDEEDEMAKYIAKTRGLEISLSKLMTDYEAQANAVLWLGTVASQCQLAAAQTQTNWARQLLTENHASDVVQQRVFAFAPEALGVPEAKYNVLFGMPRDTLKYAMSTLVRDSRVLEPEFWPKYDVAYYLQHFVPDLLQEFEALADAPWLSNLDAKIARFLDTRAPVHFDEAGRARYYLSSCFLVRAFFALETLK